MNSDLRPRAMRDAFFSRLHERMRTDDRVFVLSADFGAPTLDAIRRDFPNRFINVGIAEQNLIAVAAGLALEGFKVIGYAIAPFITMRCLEQIRVNLAILSQLRPMSVTLLGVGAGMSYDVSGPTHHCIEDLSIIGALPNVEAWSPSDPLVSGRLADLCLDSPAIRYLRFDAKPQAPLDAVSDEDLARGFAVRRSRGDVAVIATGYMAQSAASVIASDPCFAGRVRLIDVFRVNSFDESELAQALRDVRQVLLLQEAVADGPLDARVHRITQEQGLPCRIDVRAIRGAYHFEIAPRDTLHTKFGLSKMQISETMRSYIGQYAAT